MVLQIGSKGTEGVAAPMRSYDVKYAISVVPRIPDENQGTDIILLESQHSI